MERSLGLMCGAGALPALMAGSARRQGWRVVAFTFADASGVGGHAARTIPSRLTEIGPVLAALQRERVGAVLLAGRFWVQDVLQGGRPDAAAAAMTARMDDATIVGAIASTIAGLGIELLDQRTFLDDRLAPAGSWSARPPTDDEWHDVRRGLAVARLTADARVGQTVVVRRGAVMAVEAAEGTTEAIRRGTGLAGPGAVVVKAVALDHDYRFDVPTVGPATLEAAVAGGATVVAVEAGRVLVLERDATVGLADRAGVALLGASRA
ncbi:MAG: UDP-2,3-diacylglucosamine diphosphatase LpxI [Candidatus Rokubacteria bacterium]|nr:UDP-2,3-diacylglucosamine diphosphatase LpxI [Candidatus Rokubacteria bacterium]MBI4628723.1 UDP-2,3-diacylglucosamine diphosphatase LpxI [Candidatus Rokubacteria bacterium]